MRAREFGLLVVLICCLATKYSAQEVSSFEVEALRPAVVSITAYGRDGTIIGQGGGFFINAEGEVLTNREVLRDAARAEVKTFDNRSYPIEMVTAEDNSTAILKVTAGNLPGNVPFLPLSDAPLKEKETLFIVGKDSLTKLTLGTELLRIEIPTLGEFLKAAAPLPFSASGNPVLNSAGKVVGILVVEKFGGESRVLVVPRVRISDLRPPTDMQKTFAQWAEGNTSEWLATAQGLYYKGVVLQATAGCEKALPVLGAAQAEDALNAQTLFLIGHCQAQQSHSQDAIETYRRALRIKPDFAEAHSELGNAYITSFGSLGDDTFRTAIKEYQKAVEVKPDFIEAYTNLSAAYRKLGLINEEIQTYRRIIELKPDLAEAHLNLGAAYRRKGDSKEEINEYLRALKINPALVEAIYNLGNAYSRLGEVEKAIERYQEASRLNPSFALAHIGLGEVYLRLHRAGEAAEEYRKAIQLDPKSAIAYLNLGTSYLYSNKNLEAINSFRQALALRPDLSDASVNLAIAYQKRNQPEKAREALTQMSSMGSRSARGESMTRLSRIDWESSSRPGVKSAEPSYVGSMAPLISLSSEVEQANRALFLTTSQSFTAMSAAEGQQSLEKLFTAAWFTQATSSPTANDYASAAESFLRVGTPYLLKFALQDAPFVSATSGTVTGEIPTPPAESLKPGTEMEVTYFSDGLEPKRGTTRILSPKQGEISFAAFNVSPTRSDLKGIPVWIELRLKGLAFYTATLTLTVVPQTGDAPQAPDAARSVTAAKATGRNTLNAKSVQRYEPLGSHDIEIIITPDGDNPYNIWIDWKGHPGEPSFKLGLTPTGLDDLLEGVRNDLKKILDDTGQFKKEDGSNDREIDGAQMDKNLRQTLIWRLAKLGHRLYEDLFTDEQLRQRLAQIKEFAKANPATVMRIQIKNLGSSNRLLFPFGLLYDDPDFTENSEERTDAKANNFWDYRYQIEFAESKSVYQKSALCEDGPIRIAAVMDVGDPEGEGRLSAEEWRNQVEAQQRALENLEKENRISLKLVRNENEFLDIFRGKPSPLDIIYYYGHTSNTRPPSFSLTNGSRNTSQIKDAAKEKGIRTLLNHPFIFLNSCKGAAFSGRSQDTFLNVMNDLGASGFIGTETSIRIPYAAIVGQEFFKRITSGKKSITLVQALREMKREALTADDGNPLIMLYSVYGDPYVRTCSSN